MLNVGFDTYCGNVNVLNEILTPIRNRRQLLEKDKDAIMQILFKGSDKARKVVSNTLSNLPNALPISKITSKSLTSS